MSGLQSRRLGFAIAFAIRQTGLYLISVCAAGSATAEPYENTLPHWTSSTYVKGADAPIRGVIRAVDRATVSTDAALVAINLPFREGDGFKRGDLLAQFDCRRQTAETNIADAQYREAAVNVMSAIALDRQKAVGKNDVEIAKVREQRAKAELEALKPRLDECQFFAPFDGRVVDLILRVHERTEPHKPYLTIIDDSKLEIEVIVASRTLPVLKIGNPFTFQIDELEKATVTAKVKTIAAAVEPVSKTVKLIGVIEQPIAGILAGMSGTVSFASGIGQ